MKLIKWMFLGFWVISFPGLAISNPLLLQYEEKIVMEKADKDKKIQKKETIKKDIFKIYPTRFSIEQDGVETIFDFSTKTIITLDSAKHTWTEVPLYWNISYRAAEKENREYLRKTLEKTDVKFNELNQFEIESLFSLGGGAPLIPPIEVKQNKNGYAFTYNKKEVATFELGSEKIPNDIRQTYNKYVLYNFSLHPEIRKKLLGEDFIFKNLHFQMMPLPGTQYIETLTFISAKEIDDEKMQIPAGYTEFFAKGKLGEVLAASQDISKRKSKEFYQSEIDKLIQNKNHLDAFLAMSAYMFQYNVDPIEYAKKILKDTPKDSPLWALIKNLRVKSKEDYQRSIIALEGISKKNLEFGYVIDVFVANNYAKLGNSDKAIDRMLNALTINPFMVGPLKDLGDFYYVKFEMETAWQIWGEALKLDPTHPMLEPIVKYEKALEKDFPEFF